MKTQAELKSAWEKRQQWFVDRIGMRVYRPPVSCTCESCVDGHINGVLIHDETHADYLHCCESEMRLRYSDIKYKI
jgi:hypothetical protein